MSDNQCFVSVNAAGKESTEHTQLLGADGEAERHCIVPKTYPVRWFVLFVFCLHLAVGNALWVSMSPINVVIACYYGVSEYGTYALSWVFMLVYVLFFIPAGRFLDTLGLRAAVIVSGCTNAIGTWLRYAGAGKTCPFFYFCGIH